MGKQGFSYLLKTHHMVRRGNNRNKFLQPPTRLSSKSLSTKIKEIFLQEKAMDATKQKEEKREKPKPEEHEGMPPCQHCPLEKRRGDRNPECHEEQHKDAA
jgi:hypothetical protein